MPTAEQQAFWEAEKKKREKWEAGAVIVLRAIGTPGEVPVAMFDVNDEPVLVMEHSELAGRRVEKIDVANSRVTTVARDKSERVFPLLDPRSVDFPDLAPNYVEAIVSGHGRSRPENRMLPPEVMLAWNKINREGKEAILLNYLRSGLVARFHHGPEGSGASMGQLFEKQISQRNKERHEAFLAGLTPEQRERFNGGLQPVIRLTAPPEEQEAQMAKARKIKAAQDEVIAGLTPDQRKLYEAWRPPTENRPGAPPRP